MIFYSVRIV